MASFGTRVGGFGGKKVNFDDPTSLSGCQLWLDASDVSTLTESAGAVSAWADKSGNGNNFSQATGAEQPLTNATSLNGKNTIQFDGINDNLAAASKAPFNFLHENGDHFVCVVARTASQNPDALNPLMGSFDSGATEIGYMMASDDRSGSSRDQRLLVKAGNTTGTDGYYTLLTSDDAMPLGTAFVASENKSGSATVNANTFFMNNDTGAPVTAVNPATAGDSADVLTLGRLGTLATFHFGGDIAEVIIYNRSLTNEERTALNTYLSVKWGLSPLNYSGITGWYDANDRQTINTGTPADADPVNTWLDKSSNGRTLTQATGANQPLWQEDILGKQAALQFDGTNDNINGLSGLTGNATLTVFIAAQGTGTGASEYVPLQVGNQNSSAQMLAINKDNRVVVEAFRVFVWAQAVIQVSPSDEDLHVFFCEKEPGNDPVFQVDDTLGSVAASGAALNLADSLFIGSGATNSGSTPNRHFEGFVHEVLIFNRKLDVSEKQDIINNYFKPKYTNSVPLTIPNLQAWFDASDTQTINNGAALSDGDAVTDWQDKAGTANGTQGTGANQPTIRFNQFNGNAVVRFDGTDDYIDITGSPNYGLTRQFTAFVVSNRTNGATGVPLVVGERQGAGAGTNLGIRWDSNGAGATYSTRCNTKYSSVSSNLVSLTGGDDNNLEIITSVREADDDLAIYNNRELTSATDVGINANVDFTSANLTAIGAGANETSGTELHFGGEVCEILLYDRQLSDSERFQVVYNYLIPKWLGSTY